MHDPATGGHELKVAGIDGTGVAGEVLVVDGASEEIGYRFLATARGMLAQIGPRDENNLP